MLTVKLHFYHESLAREKTEKTIYGQRLYDIQRLPCIYLLDKDKQVLLKEADYGRLSAYLESSRVAVHASQQVVHAEIGNGDGGESQDHVEVIGEGATEQGE